jgi:mannosyltransferase OCH1-like enzyme
MKSVRLYLIIGISSTVFLFVVGGFLHKPTAEKISLVFSQYAQPYSKPRCPDDRACVPKARYLSPNELLSRPFPPDRSTNASVPKLIHQSWSSRDLPPKFQRWSDTWRSNHPDWEWVLWTDEDNKALVNRYFPWFGDSYQQLRGEIFRADAARNMYMYAFGGYSYLFQGADCSIYADLDVECLRPFDRLLDREITLSLSDPPSWSNESADLPPLYQKAFFGRMGHDEGFLHSIPNAWMASSPYHPFFMLPLEGIAQSINDPDADDYVEALTGPVALRDRIIDYERHYGAGRNLVEYLKTTAMNKTYFEEYNLLHSLTIFPPQIIYPFSWMMTPEESTRTHCVGGGGPVLEREICKDQLKVRENGGHCITYWTHTWAPDGPNEAGIASVMDGTRKRGHG